MLNLTKGQVVSITRLRTTGIVKVVGKKTVIVEVRGHGEMKFVLSDGRQSGAGYDCPHILAPDTCPFSQPIDEEEKCGLPPVDLVSDELPSELAMFDYNVYEQKMAILDRHEVTETVSVGDLTFEFHGLHGCEVYGEREGETFERVMDCAVARQYINFLKREVI